MTLDERRNSNGWDGLCKQEALANITAHFQQSSCLFLVLDPLGNNFWGVETFERNGRTIILGSDRDSGLWVFERTG